MTNAEIVVEFGRRLWGSNWAVGMSQFASINLRTLTRIQAAARHGEEYPAARGVIAALHDQLASTLADLEPALRAADGKTLRRHA